MHVPKQDSWTQEHMAPAGAGNGVGTCSRSAGGPSQAPAMVMVFVANVYFGTLSAPVGVLWLMV